MEIAMGLKRVLILFPLLYLAAVLDVALGRLEVAGVAPDAFALLALLWLLGSAAGQGCVAAGLIGLTADLCGPGRLGVGMACYLILGFVVGHLRSRLQYHHPLLRIGLLLPAAVLLLIGLAGCRWVLGEVSLPLLTLGQGAAGAGLYTAALAAIASALFGRYAKRCHPEATF
jgi:rod shape-determining protein MreD